MALPKGFWDKYFEVYDVLNLVIPYQELLSRVINDLQIQSGDIILDAGCGTGNLSIKMKELHEGIAVYCIDSSKEALKRFRQKDETAHIFEHDLTKPLPFESGHFNKIACVNVFYALPEASRMDILREFNRVLKIGGRLVLTNPIDKNPSKIYFEHVRKEFAAAPWYKAVWKILVFIPATVEMIYYNSKIVNTLSHTFLSEKEQRELLLESGFSELLFHHVYSDQSLEAIAEKQGA